MLMVVISNFARHCGAIKLSWSGRAAMVFDVVLTLKEQLQGHDNLWNVDICSLHLRFSHKFYHFFDIVSKSHGSEF